MRTATIIGTAAALIAVLIGLAAWLYPRSPKQPEIPQLTEQVTSFSAAEAILARLVEVRGRVIDLDLTFDPAVASYEDKVADGEPPPSYIFLQDPNGGGTEGIQINAFGLEANNVENVLGWGGPIGIMLRGNYRVIDSGIGTGGVQWVALQAQPRA